MTPSSQRESDGIRAYFITVCRFVAALAAIAAILGIAWISYWTYLDPFVEVPGPVVAPVQSSQAVVRVLFLGDFAPTDAALPLIEKRGYAYPFDGTRKLVTSFDAAVANLEAPITVRDTPSPRRPPEYTYRVHPDAVAEIRRAGIDGVTLANNHAMDYGAGGLEDTLRHLESAGIHHSGAHMSEAMARKGFVLDTPGGKLGVLSYLENKLHWRLRDLAFALDAPFRKWPGAARLSYRDAAHDIARMKRSADIIVVVAHWGENYRPVTGRQRTLGRALVDLGADVVIGHHPHQYQPVELYKGRPIVYSLGNYAFGTPGRKTMRFGMGVALHISKLRVSGMEFIPLLTQNRIVRFKPRIPSGEHLEQFFSDFTAACQRFGVQMIRRENRGWLALSRPQ